MQESAAVAEAWRRFCAGVTEGRIEEFDDIVSQQAHLIIGTAPGENVSDREAMKFGFTTEGVRLQSRSVQAFEEGTIGWVADGG
jgi:hypothetical protein